MTRGQSSTVVRLVRAWTRVYTSGLPKPLREARRAEIDSDLWESQQDGAPDGERLVRLILGIPHDLLWRAEYIAILAPLPPGRRRAVALGTVITAAALLAALWIVSPLMTDTLPLPRPAPGFSAYLAAPAPPPLPPPPPPCLPPALGGCKL